MNTFHACPDFELGLTILSWPYQTASARPPAPAWIHGKMLTASPVADDPSLTCIGGVQLRQPLAALAALTNTWRWPGFDWSFVGSSTAQTRCRLRAWSIERTVNRTSGSPGMLSATWTSLVGSPPAPESRNLRSPFASGVPMFSSRSH